MDDGKKTPASGSLPGPSRRADVRREREAEALRANLRKRKQQQRARETPVRAEPGKAPDEDPGNSF